MPRFKPQEHPRHRDGKFRDKEKRSHESPRAQRCITKVARRLEEGGEDPKRALERAFAICTAAGVSSKTRGRVFVALKSYERELAHARRAKR